MNENKKDLFSQGVTHVQDFFCTGAERYTSYLVMHYTMTQDLTSCAIGQCFARYTEYRRYEVMNLVKIHKLPSVIERDMNVKEAD